ncbi:VOC family protein [Streptomyces albidoflavus]
MTASAPVTDPARPSPPAPHPALGLLVLYTGRLEACRAFYAGLGLALVAEQHGDGPAHWSAELGPGCVLELYPAGGQPPTGRLRLALTVPYAPGGLATGRYRREDPDGRIVLVTVGQPEEADGSTA